MSSKWNFDVLFYNYYLILLAIEYFTVDKGTMARIKRSYRVSRDKQYILNRYCERSAFPKMFIDRLTLKALGAHSAPPPSRRFFITQAVVCSLLITPCDQSVFMLLNSIQINIQTFLFGLKNMPFLKECPCPNFQFPAALTLYRNFPLGT